MRGSDIDLDARGRSALRDAFVGFDTHVVLSSTSALVVAAETGSRKHHAYDCRVVTPDDHGSPTARPAASRAMRDDASAE